MNLVIEECSELIKELTKAHRGMGDVSNIEEEIADLSSKKESYQSELKTAESEKEKNILLTKIANIEKEIKEMEDKKAQYNYNNDQYPERKY